MSITETDQHSDLDAAHSEHLRDVDYMKIAVLLAALTGLEVLTYFVNFGGFAIPMLLGLMVVKFLIVVGYFMHLKYDSRFFSRVFFGGLILALIIYLALLSIFNFWGGGGIR
jgi:cytochrome c oxidase subunit 4